MKKFIALALVTAFTALTVSVQAADARIAIVDLQKVFDGYWKTKEADASLKEMATDMDKRYKEITEDWQKAREEFQKLATSANDSAVSAEEREKRQKSAEAKRAQVIEAESTLDSFRRSAAAKLDEKKKQIRDKILGEIRDAVTVKAKAGNYTHVIDTAAKSINDTPVLVYTTGENDITADVLVQLNSTAPAKK